VERGANVILLCNDFQKDEIVEGVRIISINKRYKNRWRRFIFSGIDFGKRLRKINADFYQIHEPELLIMGFILAIHGKKVVWDCHEDYLYLFGHERKYIPQCLQSLIKKMYEIVEKIIVKRFFAIITVDPAITERYRKINRNSYTVTNFPLLDEKSDTDVHIIREKIIAFAGMVPSGYRFDMLCQALKKINGYKLVLAST